MRDQVLFKGNADVAVLDYAKLSPALSAEEIKAYEQAEREWHQLLDGIAAKNFEGLLQRVRQEKDIRVSFYTKLYECLGTVNRTSMADPVEIEIQDPKSFWLKRIPTQILAHELLHALHSRHDLLDSSCQEKQHRQLDFLGSVSLKSAHTALYGQALKSRPDYVEIQRSLGSLMLHELKMLRQSFLSEYLCRYLTAQKFGPYLHGNLNKAAYMMPFGLGPRIPKQNQLEVSRNLQNILHYIEKAIERESNPETRQAERRMPKHWGYSGLV